MDITTLDGSAYNNAKVINAMPDGILVDFTGDDGFDTVKLLKFNNLPVSLQKKYGYNSTKATNFEKEHNKWLSVQHTKAIEQKNAVKEQEHEKVLEKTTDKEKALIKRINDVFNGLIGIYFVY
jgi:hypothetical protein